MAKIFIDLGHGGKDGGAQGNGLSEKTLNLTIGKKIQKLLSAYDNTEIKMSRTTDVFLELKERTDLANKWGADVLLSVHINSHTDASALGFESYIYNGSVSAETKTYQNNLHDEIMKKIGGTDRGKKKANLHMVRESNMIAVLTENLFISNKSDAGKLKEDDFLDKVAEGHVNGLVKFLGLKKKETSTVTSGTNIVKDESLLYRVQVGAFSEQANAERLAEQLKKAGYPAFITSNKL